MKNYFLCLLISLLPVPALFSAPATAQKSGSPATSGPLRVHPANPRYFADAGGRPVYLTGSHTWESLQDGILTGYTAATQPFDYNGYLDNSTGRGVVVSRNGGESWSSLNGSRLTCKQVVSITIDPHDPNRLYLGTSGNGVFVGDVR